MGNGEVEEKVDWRRVSSTHSLDDLLGVASATKRRSRPLAGLLLMLAGLVFGTLSIHAIVSSKSRSGGGGGHDAVDNSSPLFDNSGYYALLVPLTIPTVIIFVTFHWISMKFFKHAYS